MASSWFSDSSEPIRVSAPPAYHWDTGLNWYGYKVPSGLEIERSNILDGSGNPTDTTATQWGLPSTPWRRAPGLSREFNKIYNARAKSWRNLGIPVDPVHPGADLRNLPLAPRYNHVYNNETPAGYLRYYQSNAGKPITVTLAEHNDKSLDRPARSYTTGRDSVVFGTANRTPAVAEEVVLHPENLWATEMPVVPQGIGGDEGEKEFIRRSRENAQSYVPQDIYRKPTTLDKIKQHLGLPTPSAKDYDTYDATKWVYHPGHMATLQPGELSKWTPAGYNLKPAEAIQTLATLKHSMRHEHGQEFNSFSDMIPYLRENGFFIGGRVNSGKVLGARAPEYQENNVSRLFGMYRDLQDNCMLARAAYNRAKTDPIALRNYNQARIMRDNFVKDFDHYWPQIMAPDPIGTEAKYSKYDPSKADAIAKKNAENAMKFYKNKPHLYR